MIALKVTSAVLAVLAMPCASLPLHAQQTEHFVVDAHAPTTPFPHFWEQTFGSGRAILSLRESYRQDLRSVKSVTDFDSVRFHGIFMDEVGLYDADDRWVQNPGQKGHLETPAATYNFSYVDEIYDGLLANHVRPFVEMSFMPRKLAADPNLTQSFFYKPVVSPPKDYTAWDKMVSAFAAHLIARYGIDEVSTWKFEVWNEPNLDFWGGRPNQSTYWTLYDHTARAIKSISPRLQIGGPATAQAAWVGDFLSHLKAGNVPADFVSTHVYANDNAKDVFNTTEDIPRDTMVYRSVKKVHEQIVASDFPKMPLIFSEYNASYANEPNVTDTIYMGPWLANNIRLCDGLTTSMAYWSFSDVFEEQGVVRTPFYGGFGLVAADHITKPSFNAFALLHRLGDRRIPVASESALATIANNNLVLALYNYAPPDGTGVNYTKPPAPASSKSFLIDFKGVPPGTAVDVFRVDQDHGNVLKAFNAMGRPSGALSRDQVAQLSIAAKMEPAEHMHLTGSTINLAVPAHGLALVIVMP